MSLKGWAKIFFKRISVLLALILLIAWVPASLHVTRHFYEECPYNTYIDKNALGEKKVRNYYLHSKGELINKVDVGLYSNPPYDKFGIPVVHYKDIGQQYNPVTVAQLAIEHFYVYEKTKSPDAKANFLKLADWLVSHQEQGLWLYNIKLEGSKDKQWISGMAQGIGISVLIRANVISGDKKYINVAKEARKAFDKNVNNGGVANWQGSDLWFEEYSYSPQLHVLNGHIWALFGLYDYFKYSKDQETVNLFNKGVNTLTKNIYRFDTGLWIKYDLQTTNLVNNHYAKFQIQQLEILYELTGDKELRHMAERWNRYLNSPLHRIILGTTMLPSAIIKKVNVFTKN